MVVKFYKTLSENIVVNKTLTDELIMDNVIFKQSTNVLTPSINVTYNEAILNYNYVYIEDDLERYYFITDIVSLRNNVWQITLKTDVLMSFKSAISGFDVIISRGENTPSNSYLVDGENKVQNNSSVMTIAFPETPLDKNMFFILTTVGAETESEVIE